MDSTQQLACRIAPALNRNSVGGGGTGSTRTAPCLLGKRSMRRADAKFCTRNAPVMILTRLHFQVLSGNPVTCKLLN